MQKYLEPSEYIDWQHPIVSAKAAALAQGCLSDEAIAKQCFEFVRDSIHHSWDYRQNPVTCRASDVLSHGTGYCYAKSHLLAALLRANSIPAGLCYQRLTLVAGESRFALHGFNAIYLKAHGWYRVDARGNKPGVAADFCPPREQLAFPVVEAGEKDFPDIFSEPVPQVVKVLSESKTVEQVYDNLSDIDIIATSTMPSPCNGEGV